jgi:nickel/cobalt transporter (NiCoT) family protein
VSAQDQPGNGFFAKTRFRKTASLNVETRRLMLSTRFHWHRSQLASARVPFMFILIGAVNVTSWLTAWMLFSRDSALFGAAALAYILGLRHAVDADHIAAIDNVVRRLVQSGKRPVATGFFFSIGHSTVVLLAVIVIAFAASAVQAEFTVLRAVGAAIGKALAALLLLAVGAANLATLLHLWRALSARPGGSFNSPTIDMLGAPGGVLVRLFVPLFRTISESWRMLPLGFLFGLSFDTASEVGLLGISASQASQNGVVWSILVFPALFASAMTLVDTTDGVLMMHAYGWALVNPRRKLWYNFGMTLASVGVAAFIATVEIVGLLVAHAGIKGPAWQMIAALGDDLTTFGLVIVGIFTGTWLFSVIIYHLSRPAILRSRAKRDNIGPQFAPDLSRSGSL